MWRNILVTGLRVLWKDRLYAAINLVGLAVAFTAAIFIALWIRFELNWDPYMQRPDEVRVVISDVTLPQTRGFHFWNVPSPLRSELDAALGDRIVSARYAETGAVVANGDRRSVESTGFADPAFFHVITIPFLAGDPAHALDAPDSAVITRSLATKYFGAGDPMGRTLELQNMTTVRITGVIADLPDNSLFRKARLFVSAQVPFSWINDKNQSTKWTDYNNVLVLRLAGAGESDVQKLLDGLRTSKYPDDAASGTSHSFALAGLREVYLDGLVDGQSGRRSSLAALALVGVLILAIAAINFVNLATARATRRTREIGVRKALGASRSMLVIQLLAEPVLLALAALLVAFAAVEVLLPTISNLAGMHFEFAYTREPLLALTFLVGGLAVGAAAGFYPALILSRLSPVAALRAAGRSGGGSGALRQALVVAQFAASIGLIVLTIFIQRQTEHARAANLTRVAGDPLVVISDLKRLPDISQRKLLIERLAADPALRGATGSNIVQGDAKQSIATRGDIVPGQKVSYSIVRIDQNFLGVHGLRLLAGRNFEDGRDRRDDHRMTSHQPILVNVAAAKAFGYPDPAQIVGKAIGSEAEDDDLLDVIGLVEDFPMQSAKEATGPVIFTDNPGWFQNITVRVPGERMREGIQAVDRIWGEIAPLYPIQRQFADERLAKLWGAAQREADILTGFAMVAVLIGCLGLLGLSAYTAERRTKEIGIRKAMGASTGDVVQLLVLQLTRPVVAANLLAWPVALWFVQRWLAGFADRIAIDLWPFLAAGTGTLLLAWTVVIGHALAVGRARPSYALRYE
jgi:putative ABC transport system permease protein